MLPKLFFVSMLSYFIFTHICMSQCLDHQKSLLLQLKNEMIFNSSLSTELVQWNLTNNCCHWYGVECDDAGHVIGLQLDDESISGGIGDSSSLFRLEHLEKLNLAYNYFDSAPIPRGVGNLTYLTHLNLSHAGFSGQVPLEISLLRRLVSLDISTDHVIYDISIDDYRNIEPLKVENPNLETLLQNLRGIRELYLDGVNITSHDWSHITSSYLSHLKALSLRFCSLSGPLARSFGKLHSLSVLRLDGNNLSRANPNVFAGFPNLTTLSLARCSLSGPLARSFEKLHSLSFLQLSENDLSTINPNVFANFPNLTTLMLSSCNLKGSVPSKIFNIPTLQLLDLYGNEELSGSLPPFTQNGSLKSIWLIDTNFSGLIPTSIGNLKTLSEIYLSNCQFRGPIPSTFANLTRLIHIDLSYNSFTGNIPSSLFGFPSLQTLYLHNNKYIGVIEEFPIGNVSKLDNLVLSDNCLEGPVPDSFFQFQSLGRLVLSGNSFSGPFQLDKIQSFANLTELDLSGNNLSVHVSNDNSSAHGLPKLRYLILRACNMHDFPHFIKHSGRMFNLDLSNNRITGEIPNWIWGTQPGYLDLSFNHLTQIEKPYHIPPSLAYLDLQSNHLREELHLPFQANATYGLRYLSLRNNILSGSIPTSLCTATQLEALDLSINRLSGTIPSCILGSTTNLVVLDLGRNNISGRIPDSFTPSCMMGYFDVNNNTIQGKFPKSIERCKSLELLNAGNNIIHDTFPCMLSSSLRVLLLRSNRFHGEIKCSNDSWKELQIIDVSRNNFSGNLQSLNFSTWMAMVVGLDGQLRNYDEMSFNTSVVPKVEVRITVKGLEVELIKIFRDLTTIDFSCNDFRGEFPNAIGDLLSLRLLNFSHNALKGSIPKSFGKLGMLESLDLSRNKLTGHIPMELSRLTFLSVLNVSYNKLDGEIPKGRQLQTFSADSFIGNPGLCGFNLNKSCTSHTDEDESDGKDEERKEREIEWEYVSVALGYVVGVGSFAWLLLFCRRFRVSYFGKIEEVVEDILDARDRRRRRKSHARRVERSRVARRH